jgi:chromosomal replication initiation ATPase DnaA
MNEKAIAAALDGGFFRIDGTDAYYKRRMAAKLKAAQAAEREQRRIAALLEETARRVENLRKQNLIPMASLILCAVSTVYGIEIMHLTGRSRKARLVTARKHASYLMRQRTGMSLPRIGRLMNRDHTTILYEVRTFLAEADSQKITEVEQELKRITK